MKKFRWRFRYLLCKALGLSNLDLPWNEMWCDQIMLSIPQRFSALGSCFVLRKKVRHFLLNTTSPFEPHHDRFHYLLNFLFETLVFIVFKANHQHFLSWVGKLCGHQFATNMWSSTCSHFCLLKKCLFGQDKIWPK